MNNFKRIDKNIFLFLGLAIIILWQMLLPGYILTLDMIFAPKIKMFLSDGIFHNNLPLKYVLDFLNLFMPGWIIQKMLLISLFFLMGYLAFKFLPVPSKYFSNYWAGLFYVINPFVYERFLAGHWMHLFAYAFLPPFIFYLLKFIRNPELKSNIWLFFWLFLIGIFSIHFFAAAALILFSCVFCAIIKDLALKNKERAKKMLKNSAIFCLLIFVFNGFWIAPYFIRGKKSVKETFTFEYLDVFKTAENSKMSTSINVLSLHGFWGEREPWANYFIWPKDNFIFWVIFAVFLSVILLAGLIRGLRCGDERNRTILFFALAIASFIFSCGIGETVFKNFNFWIFNNVSFWPGFRDTNKFSGVLVLSYAFFGSLGIFAIMKFIDFKKPKFKKKILAFLFLVPVFYTYPMAVGFSRQLKSIWYPRSWHEANDILNQDKSDFKVLFLPWHQYFSLNFNRNIITANPAKAFFDKEIIQGENMELGKIFNQNSGEESREIERIITSEDLSVDNILKVFASKKIKYIIFANDLGEKDIFKYEFLKSENFKVVHRAGELTLYRIML